jgi:hypothetical protein
MVAKNHIVGSTNPGIGHHGVDLGDSKVQYQTIKANERLFLLVSAFTVPSGQHRGLWRQRDLRITLSRMTRGLRDVVTGPPSRTMRPLTCRGGVESEYDVDLMAMSQWSAFRSCGLLALGSLTALLWGSGRCTTRTIKGREGRSRRTAGATRPHLLHFRSRQHGPVDPRRRLRTHR